MTINDHHNLLVMPIACHADLKDETTRRAKLRYLSLELEID